MTDTTDTGPRCVSCGGVLIGSELEWDTCGHCGGRSLPRSAWSWNSETASVERRPWHRGDRLTLTELTVAAFVGLTVGLSVALTGLVLFALGWVFDALAGFLGGWTNFILWAAGSGAVLFVAWAILNPDEVRK